MAKRKELRLINVLIVDEILKSYSLDQEIFSLSLQNDEPSSKISKQTTCHLGLPPSMPSNFRLNNSYYL